MLHTCTVCMYIPTIHTQRTLPGKWSLWSSAITLYHEFHLVASLATPTRYIQVRIVPTTNLQMDRMPSDNTRSAGSNCRSTMFQVPKYNISTQECRMFPHVTITTYMNILDIPHILRILDTLTYFLTSWNQTDCSNIQGCLGAHTHTYSVSTGYT